MNVNIRYEEPYGSHTYCSKKAANLINIWNHSFGYRNFNNFSMIVRNIHKKANRTKADSIYMLLSTSDIGVGVLSMAALGICGPFWDSIDSYYNNCSRIPSIITRFCAIFLTFSSLYSPQLSLLTD